MGIRGGKAGKPKPARFKNRSMRHPAGVVVLLVAPTYREEDGEEHIRMNSARKATPRERKIYEEGL
jgi:uncharacterized DUF497 family protein